MKSKTYKKEGMTLAILVVTIIIMMILISAIVVSFNSIKTSTRKKEFAKEIYTVESLVEKYKFEHEEYPVNDSKTFSLATINSTDKVQFINEPGYATNLVDFKVIDLYEAGVENITRGIKKNSNENDVYVLSLTTGKVFYLNGEKIGDDTYYTLTDELKKEIGLTI